MRAFILTGSRDWTDELAMVRPLQGLAVPPHRALMIHGDARGADKLGAEYWRAIGFPLLPMPAQWDRDHHSAGPMRNRRMLEVLQALGACGYAISVEAFSLPQSKGTAHMKRIALDVGIVVNEHGSPSRSFAAEGGGK